MQELSADYFSKDEEPESREEDRADDGEESEMEECEREAAEPGSVEERQKTSTGHHHIIEPKFSH